MNLSKFRLNQPQLTGVLNTNVARSKLKFNNFSKLTSGISKTFNKISPKQIIIPAIVVIVAAVGVLIALSQSNRTDTFQQTVVAESPINKAITFPVTGEDGELTDMSIVMNLTSAQKTKNILIQGKPAATREGKIFLIINLELVNDSKEELKMSPVNLIRLVDSEGRKFAPDVHNEQISVEPISVKKTRVGFVVDDPSSGFALQVGRVDGTKETISLAI